MKKRPKRTAFELEANRIYRRIIYGMLKAEADRRNEQARQRRIQRKRAKIHLAVDNTATTEIS